MLKLNPQDYEIHYVAMRDERLDEIIKNPYSETFKEDMGDWLDDNLFHDLMAYRKTIEDPAELLEVNCAIWHANDFKKMLRISFRNPVIIKLIEDAEARHLIRKIGRPVKEIDQIAIKALRGFIEYYPIDLYLNQFAIASARVREYMKNNFPEKPWVIWDYYCIAREDCRE